MLIEEGEVGEEEEGRWGIGICEAGDDQKGAGKWEKEVRKWEIRSYSKKKRCSIKGGRKEWKG